MERLIASFLAPGSEGVSFRGTLVSVRVRVTIICWSLLYRPAGTHTMVRGIMFVPPVTALS